MGGPEQFILLILFIYKKGFTVITPAVVLQIWLAYHQTID
jgi:hypothetical protein